jgi:uncharacterized protein (TIGR00725 family)
MYQFCVSGAAKGQSVEEGKALARSAGRAIAAAGHSLMTGATTGLPNFAAIGYKESDGKMSLGLSPASTKVEHVVKYRLPTENYDTILYTGLHYVGRDALLITSADAVVSIGGRMGTLHEFTVAMETRTPIGFLQGTGGISQEIQAILDMLPDLHKELVIFETEADELIGKLTKLLDKLHKPYRYVYND